MEDATAPNGRTDYMEKTPADVLEEAADLLLIHGRCTGVSLNDKGEHCVVGAIAAAAELPVENICLDTYDHPARVALERRLASSGATGVRGNRGSAWIWNDSTDDDFEVIDTLRSVAKDLRNEATS